MATEKIKFPVVYKKNTNQYNSAFGKFYPEAERPETLSLRGLVQRVAFDQSVYSQDIIKGVIERLTKVMVELLQSGQAVKWDGLGTFLPGIQATKGGVTKDQLLNGDAKASLAMSIAGVTINFIPENSKGDELTSRKFKDLCEFELKGVVKLTKVGKKTLRSVIGIAQWRDWGGSTEPPTDPEP